MTTSTAAQDTARQQAEIAARTRLAWREYRDATRDETGRAYDEAESAAWDVLQAELGLIGPLEEPAGCPPG